MIWAAIAEHRKMYLLTPVYSASGVVSEIVLCYHLLLVKMKDIQVITDSLPPSKGVERSCIRIWLSSFVEACLYLWAGDTLGWTNTRLHVSINRKLIFYKPFYYFWTEHWSQHCSAPYKSDKSEVGCHNLMVLEQRKQQVLVRINSVTPTK